MRQQISQQAFELECLRGWSEELTTWARSEFLNQEHTGTRQRANLWLLKTSDSINDVMRQMPFELLDNDDMLREKARRFARLCAESGDIDGMRRIAIHYGITPPSVVHCTRLGQFRRLSCERWWR